MVFWEEIRRMKKMLMSASYIAERGKKKRLADDVIRPAGRRQRPDESNRQIPKRLSLMAQRIPEMIDDDAS
jgi:hypothetical protein